MALAREYAAAVVQPPVPVAELVRASGIRLAFEPLDAGISGMAWMQAADRVIGVNCSHPYRRQRFTIAHELAHLVLHSIEGSHVDNDVYITGYRRTVATSLPPVESEANLFAAEILMPDHLMKRDIDIVATMPLSDAIRQLANRYLVSEHALSIRLRDYLDYIERRR